MSMREYSVDGYGLCITSIRADKLLEFLKEHIDVFEYADDRAKIEELIKLLEDEDPDLLIDSKNQKYTCLLEYGDCYTFGIITHIIQVLAEEDLGFQLEQRHGDDFNGYLILRPFYSWDYVRMRERNVLREQIDAALGSFMHYFEGGEVSIGYHDVLVFIF